jgi:hypothetical protein
LRIRERIAILKGGVMAKLSISQNILKSVYVMNIVLMSLLLIVTGCTNPIRVNEELYSKEFSSSENGATLFQYIFSEYINKLDFSTTYEYIESFKSKLQNVRGSTDELVMQYIVNNLHLFVNQVDFIEIISQANSSITLDEIEAFSFDEVVQSYFDYNHQYGGKNLIGESVAEMVLKTKENFVNEAYYSDVEQANLETLFSMTVNDVYSMNEVIEFLNMSLQDNSYSSNYKSYLNSTRSSFNYFSVIGNDLPTQQKKYLASLDSIGKNSDDSENPVILVIGAIVIVLIVIVVALQEDLR